MTKPHEVTQHRMPQSYCLDCRKPLDGASIVGTDGPKDGDISICIYCGHIMAFDHAGRLRALTSDEMHEVAGDPQILLMQKVRSQVGGERS